MQVHETLQKVDLFCRKHYMQVNNILTSKRNLTEKSIKDWKIGYLPSNWKLLLKELNTSDIEVLVKLKFLYLDKFKKSNLPNYTTFANRIIYPIYNCHNQIIALSGRVVNKHQAKAKYVNTVYNKKRNCYGIDRAVEGVRKSDTAIIVEGQMDVITAHQNGLNNVVGCGSASISCMQIGLMARYCRNITILMDADEAGTKSVEKLKEKFKEFSDNVDITFMKLTDHKDLDDFFQKKSLQEFREIYKSQVRKELKIA